MELHDWKENRLKLLKRSAFSLRQKKREGIDPAADYRIGEVVYSKAHDRFGRVAELTDDKIIVDFGKDRQSFTRRKAKKSVTASSAPAVASSLPTPFAKPVTEPRQPVSMLAQRPESADDDGRMKWTAEKDEFIRDNINKPNQ